MRKEKEEIKGLTAEELAEFTACSISPFKFAPHIKVIHPLKGKVPFNLYPYQIALLWAFLKNRFNIILKFRQAGVTELISLFCLWMAMFHSHKNIVIISIKDRVAKKVLKKIKFMYRNLPDYLKVPVINGRGTDIGTSCVTPDTLIVGENRDFAIGEIVPCVKGIMDISNLNLRVLTHKGTFERITKSINKGILETWEIQNTRGEILKCTPNHRLYTTKGWRTVREIIEKNLSAIFWDSSYLDGINSPVIIKPPKEEIRESLLAGYYVSNWGRVFSKRSGSLKVMRTRISGHERIKLKGSGQNKFYSVHKLVWEAFNGPIPNGLIIDHIDCIKTHNWLNNLQAITPSENTKRAYQYNRTLVNNNYIPTRISLRKLGKLKLLDKKQGYGTGRIIANKLGLTTKQVSHYRRDKACGHIYVSKLTINRVFENVICDIEVENNHSYISKSHFLNHNTELEFSNGSIISSIPTTEDAGRSEAVSLLVMDEAAIVRWAEKIWSAAFPTLSTGGRAIINSTAYGVDNFFHTLWVNAFAGGNPFVPIRLRWKMHPERDQAWYDEQRSILGERRTAQEIDGDFLTSGNTVFDLVDIRALEELIPKHKVIDHALNGRLKIYKQPVPGEKYFLAADVSTGRSRDYSTILILNRKGEEMLSFKGKIPIKRLTKLIRKYGKKYNWALVAPESNDIGLSVASDLEEAHYPNLYYSKALIRKKGESKPKEELIPGWYTTRKNRGIIIAELEDDIRNDVIRPKNQFFVDEAYTFIYDNNNRPVAMNKNSKAEDDILKDDVHTDDMILTYAIANRIRKGKIRKTVNPK